MGQTRELSKQVGEKHEHPVIQAVTSEHQLVMYVGIPMGSKYLVKR